MDLKADRLEITVSTRTLIRIVLWVAILVAVLSQLYAVRHVVLLVFVAAFLAVALEPAVHNLQKMGMRRGIATAAVTTGVLGGVTVLLFIILTPLYSEVVAFVDNLPTILSDLRRSQLLRELDQRFDVIDRLSQVAADLPQRLPATLGALLGIAGRLAGALVSIISVLVMTIFILLELPSLRENVNSLLTPETATRYSRMADEISHAISRFVAGSLAVATLAAVVTYTSLSLLGVPFALALSLLMFLFDLIPLVGATMGSVVVILVAFTQGTAAGLIMLAVMVTYQQVENNFIQPVVMHRTVRVSPLVVLPIVLAGAALLGVVGALLAIPVAGSIQIITREYIESRRRDIAQHRAAAEALEGGSATMQV